MNIDIVTNWFDFFLAFAAVIGVVAAFIRWGQRGLERKILSEIKASTVQIQRNANGGQSLKDLHDKVDRLVVNQDLIKCDVELLKQAVVILENEKEGL